MPIEVKNLSFTYSAGTPFETAALKNISLEIQNGEFIGVMGHTGCGKSTLIRALAGLIRPTEGNILIDGSDINGRRYDRSELRRKLGVVFQYPECQLFETTVEKDVAFGLRHSGLNKDEVTERVRWALEVCGFDFEKIAKASPMGLSGGEKRRVAIAGVLAVKPEYLILDEPIAGLDPLGREAFLELITGLNADGMTIIMVSHNADCIGEYARRVLLMSGGELIGDGSPEELFSDVERMRSLNLGVSRSREIAWLLKKGGMDIPQDICSYDRLLPAVLAQLGGGDGHD